MKTLPAKTAISCETGNNLTIPILCAYLPWDTKIMVSHRNQPSRIAHLTPAYIADPSGIQLLLRPLSDLTKEVTHNGETFVPVERLFNMAFKEVYDHDYNGRAPMFFDDFPGLSTRLELDLPKDSIATRVWDYGFTVELPTCFRMSANGSYLNISQFALYEKLFEWHFDVHNGIENGWALNINEHNAN